MEIEFLPVIRSSHLQSPIHLKHCKTIDGACFFRACKSDPKIVRLLQGRADAAPRTRGIFPSGRVGFFWLARFSIGSFISPSVTAAWHPGMNIMMRLEVSAGFDLVAISLTQSK